MNRGEIAALARSPGNTEAWKREAALDTTPAMIENCSRWPGSLNSSLLRCSGIIQVSRAVVAIPPY